MAGGVISRIIYHGIKWSLGLLFIYSGTVKLMDLKDFSQVVDAFGLIPWEYTFPGALFISLAEVLAGAGLGDLDKPVVIYCGFVKCTRSHNGAMWAKKMGYKNVFRYPGGIFAWKGAGFDIEKSDN